MSGYWIRMPVDFLYLEILQVNRESEQLCYSFSTTGNHLSKKFEMFLEVSNLLD